MHYTTRNKNALRVKSGGNEHPKELPKLHIDRATPGSLQRFLENNNSRVNYFAWENSGV